MIIQALGKEFDLPDGTTPDKVGEFLNFQKSRMEAAPQAASIPDLDLEAPPTSAADTAWQKHLAHPLPTAVPMSINPASMPDDISAEEARKAIALSGGQSEFTASAFLGSNVLDRARKRRAEREMQMHPAIAAYVGNDPVKAAAIGEDAHNLGVIDWALGKFKGYRPVDDTDPSDLLPEGPQVEEVREIPTSVLQIGRMFLESTSAVQTVLEKHFGHNYGFEFGAASGQLELHSDQGVDPKRLAQDRVVLDDLANLPGEHASFPAEVLGALTGGSKYMVPGLGQVLMYTDAVAGSYTAMLEHGVDESTASLVSEGVGGAAFALSFVPFGKTIGKGADAVWSRAHNYGTESIKRLAINNPGLMGFLAKTSREMLGMAVMNAGMESASAYGEELAEAQASGRPVNWSGLADRLNAGAANTLKFLPLAALHAYGEVGQERQQYRAYVQAWDAAQLQNAYMEHPQFAAIRRAYKEAGHALSSYQDAMHLSAAVDAAERSGLAQESPREFRTLVNSMLRPGASQSVFVDPSALLKAEPNPGVLWGEPNGSGGMQNIGIAAMTGQRVEVPIVKFITHPMARDLLKDAASQPGGWTLEQLKANRRPVGAGVEGPKQQEQAKPVLPGYVEGVGDPHVHGLLAAANQQKANGLGLPTDALGMEGPVAPPTGPKEPTRYPGSEGPEQATLSTHPHPPAVEKTAAVKGLTGAAVAGVKLPEPERRGLTPRLYKDANGVWQAKPDPKLLNDPKAPPISYIDTPSNPAHIIGQKYLPAYVETHSQLWVHHSPSPTSIEAAQNVPQAARGGVFKQPKIPKHVTATLAQLDIHAQLAEQAAADYDKVTRENAGAGKAREEGDLKALRAMKDKAEKLRSDHDRLKETIKKDYPLEPVTADRETLTRQQASELYGDRKKYPDGPKQDVNSTNVDTAAQLAERGINVATPQDVTPAVGDRAASTKPADLTVDERIQRDADEIRTALASRHPNVPDLNPNLKGAPTRTPADALRDALSLGKPAPDPEAATPRNAKAWRRWAAEQVIDKPISSLETGERQHANLASVAKTKLQRSLLRVVDTMGTAAKKAREGTESGVESAESAIRAADAAIKKLKELAKEDAETPPDPDSINDITIGAQMDVQVAAKLKAKAEGRGTTANKAEVKAAEHMDRAAEFQKAVDSNKALAKGHADAAKEAAGAQRAVDKLRSAGMREAAYKAGELYGKGIDALAEALGNKPKGHASGDVSDLGPALRGAYEQLGADGHEAEFDTRVLNQLINNPREFDALTVRESREVAAFVEQVTHVIEAKNKATLAGKATTLEGIGERLHQGLDHLPTMGKGQNASTPNEKTLSAMEKVSKWMGGAAAELHQPLTLLARLGDVGNELIFDHLLPAMQKEEDLHRTISRKVENVVASLPDGVRNSGHDVIAPPDGAPANWGNRTRSDVWRMMLHLGTEDTTEKLARGLKLNPQTLHSWVAENLGATPEHGDIIMRQLVQPLWDVYAELWQHQLADMKARGVPPPKQLAPVTITHNGQEYKGNYGGRLRWTDHDLRTNAEPATLEHLYGDHSSDPSVDERFLEERTNYAGVPHLDFSSIGTDVRDQIHSLSFRQTTELLHSILHDRDINALLKDKIGSANVDALYAPGKLNSWLYGVARGSFKDSQTANVFINAAAKLQGRAAVSAFGLNARVMFGQLSHVFPAMVNEGINPINMTRGMWRALDGDRRAWAHENSNVLSFRSNDFERRNIELIREVTGHQTEGMSNEISMHMYHGMDDFLSHAIWEAKALQSGAEAADKSVMRVMPATTIYEKSAFARDRGLAGLSFLVRNFPNTLFNLNSASLWDAKMSAAKPGATTLDKGAAYTKAAAKIAGTMIGAEVVGKAMIQGLWKDNETPEEWLGKKFLHAPLYQFPLGPELTDVLDRAAEGKPGRPVRLVPGVDNAATALWSLGSAVLHSEDQDGEKVFMEAANFLGFALGRPIRPLAQAVVGAAHAASGDEEPVRAAGTALGYRH